MSLTRFKRPRLLDKLEALSEELGAKKKKAPKKTKVAKKVKKKK